MIGQFQNSFLTSTDLHIFSFSMLCLFFQICVNGNQYTDLPGTHFFFTLGPAVAVTALGFIADMVIYFFVRKNSFGRSTSNEIIDPNESNESLTEHQRLMLHYPLNAITASLISASPLVACVIIGFSLDISSVTKFHLFIIIFCIMQFLRNLVILRCLFSANQANQLEMNKAKSKSERQKWEIEHAFKTSKAGKEDEIEGVGV